MFVSTEVEDPELQLMRPTEPLAPAFATLGWFGGLWADEICAGIRTGLRNCDPGGALHWLVPEMRLGWGEKLIAAAIVAVAMWIAGAISARHLTHGGGLLAVTAISIGTCALTGMLVGMFTLSSSAAGPGRIMTLGLTVGLTTAPACALAAQLSYRAWCVRPNTMAHRLCRRAMGLAVVAYVVLVSARFAQLGFAHEGLSALDVSRWNTLSHWGQRDRVGACLLVGGTAVGIAIGALSLIHLARLGGLRKRLTAKQKRGSRGEVKRFDLGIGEAELRCVVQGTNPYRDNDHLVASCRGDFKWVGRNLRWAAAGASALVLIAVLTLTFRDLDFSCYGAGAAGSAGAAVHDGQ